MYILTWYSQHWYNRVCGDYPSVWQVYWYIKNGLKSECPTHDIFVMCVDSDGRFLDLECGPALAYGSGPIKIRDGIFPYVEHDK